MTSVVLLAAFHLHYYMIAIPGRVLPSDFGDSVRR